MESLSQDNKTLLDGSIFFFNVIFIFSVKIALYFMDNASTKISFHSNFGQTKIHSVYNEMSIQLIYLLQITYLTV
jgi:hypothetical protein